MRKVNTLTTNAFGAIISAFLGLITGVVITIIVLMITGLSSDWWFLGILPTLLAGGAIFQSGRQHSAIAVGFVGVPKFLGERIAGFVLSEGHHWLIPFLMSFDPVDVRIKTTAPENVKALSTDNVEMTGSFFATLKVIDPHTNLSADAPLTSLMKIGESRFRDGIAGKESEVLERPATWSTLAADIKTAMGDSSALLGYEVIKVEIPEILPPPEIPAAAAHKRIEEAQLVSEGVERKGVIAWIDDLGAKGVKPELALETMQTERGKATATRHIIRLEGAQGIADTIKQGIVEVFGAKKGGS
ncbi:MAG: hypothetical protein AB199_02275 [Parcubacteria bacterium C7867-004]|nr:MAG: hypothetical protein AB199_02275 [Parcubacteria bacterium C7867-004]